MITYKEWYAQQNELESRARTIWLIYGQIFNVYRYKSYDLDGIDSENGARFSAYIHNENETDYIDTKVLFMSDEEVVAYYNEILERTKREAEEKKSKEELERAKRIEESERKQLALLKAKYE